MGPLKGVRVLELGRVLAAPWCGQMMADLGAEVIKVEHPAKGDDTRSWGPPNVELAPGTTDAAYFLAANRGKKSICIDFATEAGQEVVRALAKSSDILLENFRVNMLKRYKLDYETVAQDNPGIIYCSVTGFGQTGPRRTEGGYDANIQAMGGLMSITGVANGEPGGGPMKVGVPVVDLFTGMYASIGVLAALNSRNETGKGQRIDLGLFDVQLALLANQGMNYLIGGKSPVRRGNDHPNVVPCGCFVAREGQVMITIGNDVQFRRLAEGLGRPELADDPRFVTNIKRANNRMELFNILNAAFLEKSAAEWIDRLVPLKVPAAVVNDIAGAFADPQAVARETRFELTSAAGTTVPMIRNPLRFSNDQIEYASAPPRLGEHTSEVLSGLGFSAQEIARLEQNGTARTPLAVE